MGDNIRTDCRHICDKYDHWDRETRHWFCGRFNSRIGGYSIVCRGCNKYAPSDASQALAAETARAEKLEAERDAAIDHMTAVGVAACRERDERIATLEAERKDG